MKQDYYEKLEVSPDCTDEQIKESYRILAKMYHPDNHVNSADNVKLMAARKFNEIREAYKTLSDVKLRAKYDRSRLDGQLEHEDGYYEEEHYDEYGGTYEYQPHGYTQENRPGQNEHENQLNEVFGDFRKGVPRAVKAAGVFAGVLGWIMFISFAFGNWGSYYPEEQPHVEFSINFLMEQNDELRRQLEQSSQHSLQLVHDIRIYEQWISELIIEIATYRIEQQQLEQLLQLGDWREIYTEQIDDLSSELLVTDHRLSVMVNEFRLFLRWVEDIYRMFDDILQALEYHDDELYVPLQWLGVLLHDMQRLEGSISWWEDFDE